MFLPFKPVFVNANPVISGFSDVFVARSPGIQEYLLPAVYSVFVKGFSLSGSFDSQSFGLVNEGFDVLLDAMFLFAVPVPVLLFLFDAPD